MFLIIGILLSNDMYTHLGDFSTHQKIFAVLFLPPTVCDSAMTIVPTSQGSLDICQ